MDTTHNFNLGAPNVNVFGANTTGGGTPIGAGGGTGGGAGLGVGAQISKANQAVEANPDLFALGISLVNTLNQAKQAKQTGTPIKVNGGSIAAKGAAMGASIGSSVPVLGTALGAGVGAATGFIMAKVANGWGGKWRDDRPGLRDKSGWGENPLPDLSPNDKLIDSKGNTWNFGPWEDVPDSTGVKIRGRKLFLNGQMVGFGATGLIYEKNGDIFYQSNLAPWEPNETYGRVIRRTGPNSEVSANFRPTYEEAQNLAFTGLKLMGASEIGVPVPKFEQTKADPLNIAFPGYTFVEELMPKTPGAPARVRLNWGGKFYDVEFTKDGKIGGFEISTDTIQAESKDRTIMRNIIIAVVAAILAFVAFKFFLKKG